MVIEVSIPRAGSVTSTRYLTLRMRGRTMPPWVSVVPERTVPLTSTLPLIPKRSKPRRGPVLSKGVAVTLTLSSGCPV
jgi:hypothetical protein